MMTPLEMDPMELDAGREMPHTAAGRSLADFLYPAPARRTIPSILGWWERRRIPFNLMVGAAGSVSVVALLGSSLLFGAGLPTVSGVIVPVAVFGILANVCYSLGPIVEILVDKLWGRQVLPVGPALYRMGLTFSVGLAFFPVLLVVVFTLIRIVVGIA